MKERSKDDPSLTQPKKTCIASELCSYLMNMDQSHAHRTVPMRQFSPEFEAPAWAVPAPGESRLEVSLEMMSFIHLDPNSFISVSHFVLLPMFPV